MSVRKRRTCSVLVAALPVLLLGARAGGAEERGGRVEKVVLAIHGGAGDLPKDRTSPELARRREGIERALEAGYNRLKKGGTSLDAVEAAIRVMEDDPWFNAGKGAVFTHEMRNELDASIMEGKGKRAGAVAGVTIIKNPISAARRVMEKSKHVLLTGRGAELFALKQNLEVVDPSYFRTEYRLKELQEELRQEEKEKKDPGRGSEARRAPRYFGTVGAVARDRKGDLAAGTSTGGMTNKMAGRVGDSPVIGAGTYADNAACAVSCTGHGEVFIRYAVAHDIAARMKYGNNARVDDAVRQVIMGLPDEPGGVGGAIALDARGNLGVSFTTERMYRGYVTSDGKVHVIITEERPSNPPAKEKREPDLHPGPPAPLPAEKLRAAVRRGVAFLLKDQNADGSWGSAERTKDLNIYAPVPGAHHAFRTAVTALCVSALIEVNDGSEAVGKAIERGEDYLLEWLPKVRRANPTAIYNVWTHAYGIDALVHMWRRLPQDKERRHKIEELIRTQYDLLTRYESVAGGWGYYDFGAQTQRPDSSPNSFVNATVLVAFHEAKAIGVPPPRKVTDRAIEGLGRQRKPDFSYLYGEDLRWLPMRPINRPGGSVGRSQACNLALRLWGDKRITDAVLKAWLDRLITRNGWLDMGRKRPIPHESHFQVAGYFYYYGHYYAALCAGQLKAEDRPFYETHLAHILLDKQEKDGSWWDYPLYNYHQQWGTAMALMSLKRCEGAAR